MEGRIRQLEAIIKNAEIVEGSSSDAVQAGSVVEIRYQGDDESVRYLIGSIEEKSAELEVMSPGSPLGKALLGAKAGEIIDFVAPKGNALKVEIVSVG